MEDYYQVAPRLVPLLDNPRIAEDVWNDISETVKLVENGYSFGALASYRMMVDKLLREEAELAISSMS